MAYKKYNLGGREMLNLDNYGMVDYNEYYSLWQNSNERRSNISDKFLSAQKSNMLKNEPTMNYSVQYQKFLEELKTTNPDIYNQKLMIYKEYITALQDEEKQFAKEKQQLLLNGYPFDSRMKKYGYCIFEMNGNYFQYKCVVQKDVKIDMGDNLIPQQAEVSSYEIIPVSSEELQEIEANISIKEQNVAHKYK